MKMRIITTAVAAAMAAGMGGCAVFRPAEPPALNVTYEAPDNPATGLIRAFVVNGNTVLQFYDAARSRPTVYAVGSSTPMPYQLVGQQLAVLHGTPAALRIVAQGATATVTMKGIQAHVASAPATQAAATPQEDAKNEATARADLGRVQGQIDQLQKQLTDTAHPPSRATVAAATAQIAKIDARIADDAKIILLVHFDFNSADFNPPPDVRAKLLKDAALASLINVRGRTDSAVADAGDARIALARALAARDWLVKHGVSKSKIRVFSEAAGSFMADDSTASGRALNRRVIIELLGSAAARGELRATTPKPGR